MDKRWLGIIIVLIAGIGCMYFIVDSSTTVGKAVTVVDEMTITLPPGFNILKQAEKDIHLIDHGNHSAKITIICKGDKSLELYEGELESLNNNSQIEVKDTIQNETGNIIVYKNITSGREYSITYVVKDKRTISIKMDMYDKWGEDLCFISDTIQHNYKQNG